MTIGNKKEPFILLLGDIFVFCLSLWIALTIRTGSIPSKAVLFDHFAPFGILFVVSVLIFFIAGLYEKHTVLFKSKLPSIIFNSLIANSIIAVAFFYIIPYFGITPKTILFIYLIVSFVLVLFWRMYGYQFLTKVERENALIIGSGSEMKELYEEVNNNTRYSLRFVSCIDLDNIEHIDFQEDVVKRIYAENIGVIAIDLHNEKLGPILPRFYNLIFSNVHFIEMHKIYEDVFDKVPLSLLKYSWFLENISTKPKIVYDTIRRIMDVVLAFILSIPTLIILPFVYLVIKLDDRGTIFIKQERVGENNFPIYIYKFRTMSRNDEGKYGAGENKVTRVGGFLRKSRIDELPQLWNVLRGDISLIGPRPELPALVKSYEQEIPYYNVRHLIKPGLSGWAQMYHEQHPHHKVDVEETRNKLSYDLYYIKNRSFLLDIKITLRTVKTLLSRAGL